MCRPAQQNGDVRHQVGGEAAVIDEIAFLIDLQSVVIPHVAEVGRIDAFNGIALHRRAADRLLGGGKAFRRREGGDRTRPAQQQQNRRGKEGKRKNRGKGAPFLTAEAFHSDSSRFSRSRT